MEYEEEERTRDPLKRVYPESFWNCRIKKEYYLKNQCPAIEICKERYPNLICECGWR